MSAHDQDSRELRTAFAQQLLDDALHAVRRLAALDSDAPSAMLEVLDELREIVHAEIDADLVEVSPGAFLPSHEATKLIALRALDAETERALTAYETARELTGRRVVVMTTNGVRISGVLDSVHDDRICVVSARKLKPVALNQVDSIKAATK